MDFLSLLLPSYTSAFLLLLCYSRLFCFCLKFLLKIILFIQYILIIVSSPATTPRSFPLFITHIVTSYALSSISPFSYPIQKPLFYYIWYIWPSLPCYLLQHGWTQGMLSKWNKPGIKEESYPSFWSLDNQCGDHHSVKEDSQRLCRQKIGKWARVSGFRPGGQSGKSSRCASIRLSSNLQHLCKELDVFTCSYPHLWGRAVRKEDPWAFWLPA